MTGTRNCITTILLAGFFISLVCYFNEFSSLHTKCANLNYVMESVVDSSVEQCILSDDFYLNGNNYGNGSVSQDHLVTPASLWVFNKTGSGSGTLKNMLSVSDNYNTNGGGIQGIKSMINAWGINTNISSSVAKAYTRKLYLDQYDTISFRRFYDWLDSTGLFKTKIYSFESNSYVGRDVFTLALMGVNDTQFTNGLSSPITTTDEINSIEKEGKNGNYYLTPTALGITYIDKNILKPVLINNFQYMMATHYGEQDTGNKHFGCLNNSTRFYEYRNLDNHQHSSNEYIVNDGYFELDLNSITPEIEYIVLGLDFNDQDVTGLTDIEANNIRERVLGYSPTVGSKGYKYIVVAKITVKSRIYMQYSSWVMQRLSGNTGNSTLSVQTINSDGTKKNYLEYSYTTYKAVVH